MSVAYEQNICVVLLHSQTGYEVYERVLLWLQIESFYCYAAIRLLAPGY